MIDKGGDFNHGYTYSGHPVACAVAVANLDIIVNEDLPGAAERQGVKLRAKLQDALGDHPLVGEIRGRGLIGAIELVEDRTSHKSYDSKRKVGGNLPRFLHREWADGAGGAADTMVFSPPLIISDAEIDAFADSALRAIDQTVQNDQGLTFSKRRGVLFACWIKTWMLGLRRA